MKITSDAGDETLLTHDPQGIMLTILPEKSPVSPDILDIIAVGISHSSIKKYYWLFKTTTAIHYKMRVQHSGWITRSYTLPIDL